MTSYLSYFEGDAIYARGETVMFRDNSVLFYAGFKTAVKRSFSIVLGSIS